MRLALALLAILFAAPSWAETSAEAIERRPALFDSETGFRLERHRAPTPSDIPGPATRIEAAQVAKLVDPVLIDVFATKLGRYDEFDGTWLGETPRETVPGAIWLPEVGRGSLSPELADYLRYTLHDVTGGDKTHPVVVFCVADCWMSWNAAQRVAGLGYRNVYWLREGTDGWLDIGGRLCPADPIPVTIEE
jgi:PQQ-dependent catabolism-associated CXXCW motif protein